MTETASQSLQADRALADADIAIIGGGASGTEAAIVLARAGYSIMLIDMHEAHPPEFRCEKLVPEQADILRRLGLFGPIAEFATKTTEMAVVRRGAMLSRIASEEYGFDYHDLVGALRRALPSNVRFLRGRVTGLETSADIQRINLDGGVIVTAKLAVLATGLSPALRQKLGIVRRMLHERHTLSAGFAIQPAAGHDFPFQALTYYNETVGSGLAYITIFPVGTAMRANLFGYLDLKSPFIAELRRDPQMALYKLMPGLRRYLGAFEVTEKVQLRLMDLYVAQEYRRDGLLLLGDAFQTACPAAGTGMRRCLIDVERLLAHTPSFFATPGMSAEKLQAYYDDPVKQASDAFSAHAANYTKRIAIDRDISWRLKRFKADTVFRMRSRRA